MVRFHQTCCPDADIRKVFAAPTTGVLSIHPARQSPGVTKIKRQWPPGVSVSDGGSASGRKVRASPPWEDVSNTPDNA